MKKIILIGLFALLFGSCDNKRALICGVEDPISELNWLSEIVEKSENDTTGNYTGNIFLLNYNNQQIIFIDMPMGSGGLYGYWFNCDGSPAIIDLDNPPSDKQMKLLYSNIG